MLDQQFDVEPEQWDKWPETLAQQLLEQSVAHGSKRFAAERGIAFCAQETIGGVWHGYPVPWRVVPDAVRSELVATGQVEWRQIRRGIREQSDIDPRRPRDYDWAVRSDE